MDEMLGETTINGMQMKTYRSNPNDNTLVIPLERDSSRDETVTVVPSTGGISRLHSGPSLLIPPPPLYTGDHRNLFTKNIEICIFLADRSGVEFTVEGGKLATAQDLHELVVELLEMPSIAKELFALWVVSPFLEIQLKPHHTPFRIVQQWPELLLKYTMCSNRDVNNDEPLLLFRRNAFFPKSREKEVSDKELIRLLYEEAKFNVIEGRYPCSEEDALRLAGLQAAIEYGEHDPVEHRPAYFKEKVTRFLPEKYHKSSLFKTRPEEKISTHYSNTPTNSRNSLHRFYLEHCWHMPYYGSAFFSGQIERPTTMLKSWMQNMDIDVWLAVNTSSAFIIDKEKTEVLLGLPFEKLSWEFAKPSKEGEGHLPCLFLQFAPCDKESSEPCSKLLQVFSKQAPMMDAMIESCILLKTGSIPSTPSTCTSVVYPRLNEIRQKIGSVSRRADVIQEQTDGAVASSSGSASKLAVAIPNMVTRMEKMVLATFNQEGEILQDQYKKQAWRFK